MDVIVPFCGAARCATHNKVFLEGQKSALLAVKGVRSYGAGSDGGERGEWSKDEWEVGMRAFGRGYAGWGFSQAFYREKVFETHLGYKDLEDFLVEFWEKWAVSKDPENMLTMVRTWQTADVSQQEPYNGDFKAAMQAIQAKTLVLPCKTDLYFPPEDSEIEVSLMREGVATLAIFPSIWGHWAGEQITPPAAKNAQHLQSVHLRPRLRPQPQPYSPLPSPFFGPSAPANMSNVQTTELTGDMSEWSESYGISDGLGREEGQNLSGTGSESGPEWFESRLGGSLESEPEWLESLSGVSLENEPEYGSEDLSRYASESPTESGPRSGSEGPSDISMRDATSIPSLTYSSSDESNSSSNPSTAEYGSLHFSFEDSAWNILTLTTPIPASLDGSEDTTPSPPPPPPHSPWDGMEGIEFAAMILRGEGRVGPWREEAGDPFVGSGSGDGGEGAEGSGSRSGSLEGSPSNSGTLGSSSEERFRGERSRAGSVAEGSEFGELVEGSWEEEEIIRMAILWGEEEERWSGAYGG
ncbi:hypothetical protein V493_05356, partial [Pseudogymnoascus sp. VKM F-4281 (FW-2241)]